MVGLGMLFHHQKYSEFGINIFQYADVLYFLIAPFEDIRILLLSTFIFALHFVATTTDNAMQRKTPRLYKIFNLGLESKTWHKTFGRVIGIIMVPVLLAMYANAYGETTKKRIIESSKFTTLHFNSNDSITGKFIGKTDTVLFLLHENVVKAIPIASTVKAIDIGILDDAGDLKDAAPTDSPPDATKTRTPTNSPLKGN